jgi:anaerobic magnesium-protoporphyrin IX monomethyl ester cyclase
LQFGYPGETHEDIDKTRKMVYECDPDDIGISVSYPMPGTKFYSSVQSQLGTVQNWQDSSDLAMLYHGAYSTGYYRKLYNVIHSEFRRRKAWRSLQRKLDLRIAVRVVRHTLILPVRRIQLRMAERQPTVALVVPHLTHEEAANPTPQERQ